jgi:adenylate cyclase
MTGLAPQPDGHEHDHDQTSEAWRGILTGNARGLRTIRRLVGWIPAGPRCKLCLAPLRAPGSVVLRPFGFGPSKLNRRLCRACFRSIGKYPGGAEVEITLLFADVRGSTALAEQMKPQEFSGLIARFYGTAAKVIDARNGIIDKFVGDEVVALFIPGFAGDDHAARAVDAARALMQATGNDTDDPWVPVGAGVHTGVPYVGRVGEGDACDFTAVGDPVNTTARLASNAAAGEILVSSAAAQAAALDTTGLEMRTLELRGREESAEVWVARA